MYRAVEPFEPTSCEPLAPPVLAPPVIVQPQLGQPAVRAAELPAWVMPWACATTGMLAILLWAVAEPASFRDFATGFLRGVFQGLREWLSIA